MDYPLDVAISFLAKDSVLALELREKLIEGLKVFAYSKEQEHLAGTDGLETLRAAFAKESRLVVVLYRDGWGQTPWTRVEQTAITDRALSEGWDFLFFVTLDKTSSVPKWLPQTRIRLSLPDYGLDQAAGAIKRRVEELGGRITQLDAIGRAKAAAGRVDSLRQTEDLLASKGYAAAKEEAQGVIAEAVRLAKEIQVTARSLGVQFGTDGIAFLVTTGGASANMYVHLTIPAHETRFILRFFLGRILLPQERGKMLVRKPVDYSEKQFYFSFQTGVGWCWLDQEQKRVLTSLQLADYLVSEFVSLAENVARGKISRSDGDEYV